MSEWSGWFYKTKAWVNTSKAYAKSVGGLCERCRKKGMITAGEIVHHKVHLTPDNIDDPMIALSWDNLELLCREHHAQEHSGRKKRWKVDELGRVTTPR